ncbi:MAG: hypothetical protein HY981_02145 [Candidatus Magasanikbacteria bacterium]|nr:hypothetical protein [Candidatus Magasanikbacteria bacterium]
MAHITDEEIKFLEQFRSEGVLEDINTKRVDASRGAILVTCADGDQMADVFQQTEHLSFRLHTLSLNGGGLILPEESPANILLTPPDCSKQIKLGDVFLGQIITARALKNINLIALHVHCPCGVAGAFKIGPRELIALLVAAKDRIKKSIPGIKVCAFIHIAWPDGRKRTYFVSREKWRAYSIK